MLAAGMLRALDALDLVDRDFVARRTSGFAEARAAVEPYTPDRVAAMTGIDGSALLQACRRFAAARSAVLLHARGAEQQVGGTASVLAWINVALAAGRAGRPGCGVLTLTGQRNGQGAREHGQRCDQLPGYRRIDDPTDRAVVAARWGVDEAALPGLGLRYVDILRAATRGDVSGLLVLSTNPAVSRPDSALVRTP